MLAPPAAFGTEAVRRRARALPLAATGTDDCVAAARATLYWRRRRMNSGPTISEGSTGPDVRRLQRLLVMMKMLDYIGIDGNFGPHTKTAVEAFQQGNGLTVDGIV